MCVRDSARDVAGQGCIPGIWIRPLMTAERVPDGSVSAYSFLTFLIPALALGIFLAVPSKQPLKPLDRRLYLYGGLLAVAVFVINQLATLAASLVDSVVLFGFINGLSLIHI